MRTVVVNNFSGGMADDPYNATASEFSISKHFDILTYPNRLQPLRGMTAETTANTSIGNIIVNSTDGLMYGIGVDYPTSPTLGQLWYRNGYGGSDTWQVIPTTRQLSGAAVNYNFLVDFRDAGNIRTLHWASTNLLLASDPAGGSSATTQALTFSSIGQGFVHPKDKVLYFPYNTTANCIIGSISSDATPFNTHNFTALTLPKQYRAYCLTNYGNYLAIPLTTAFGAGVSASQVGLWSRDTSLATLDEIIPWGAGDLKVLNNLNGVLIGISTASVGFSGSVQDSDSIFIKAWDGGAEPVVIKEIKANHLFGASHPTVTINPNVNFIYKNRLYFSVNVVPNDGVSNSYYGLWSVGKNRAGRYTVTMERVATNNNSETGVLAAAISGDFVATVHSAVGTMTASTNGQSASGIYGATSVYESAVNPDMPFNPHRGVLDPIQKKQLMVVAAHYMPLQSGSQVVMKYRVDSTGAWTTIFTETTVGAVVTEMTNAAGIYFTAGRNYEFRLESTGGAVITGFTYKYEVLPTQL